MNSVEINQRNTTEPDLANYDCLAIYYRDMARYNFFRSVAFVVHAKLNFPDNKFSGFKSFNDVPG